MMRPILQAQERPLTVVHSLQMGAPEGESRIESLLLRLCIAVERLADTATPWPSPAALSRLTPAEVELLACVRQGKSNKEIAAIRHTSTKTVKGQLSGLYQKLGITNRTNLLAQAASRLSHFPFVSKDKIATP